MNENEQRWFDTGTMAGQRSLVAKNAAPIGPLYIPSLAGVDAATFRSLVWFWSQVLDERPLSEPKPAAFPWDPYPEVM